MDYAINTHWHFDHAEGNNALGPRGTTIVAHKNARVDMAAGGIVNLVIQIQTTTLPKASFAGIYL